VCPSLQNHPKDAEFLNTPIRFYFELETFFGSTLTTGRFALGSNEPLGVNKAESVASKPKADCVAPKEVHRGKTTFDYGEGSNTIIPVSETVCGQRKRGTFTEEEILMMTNMNDAVSNVTNAMIKTDAAHVDPNLYLAVMDMTNFSTDALIVAYTYLLEHKAIATGFVQMSTPHRAIWLRTYLGKN
jgi:hypothetical protein